MVLRSIRQRSMLCGMSIMLALAVGLGGASRRMAFAIHCIVLGCDNRDDCPPTPGTFKVFSNPPLLGERTQLSKQLGPHLATPGGLAPAAMHWTIAHPAAPHAPWVPLTGPFSLQSWLVRLQV